MRGAAHRLEACEFGPDHVHVFVSRCKNYSVPEIVRRLKGASSRRIRLELENCWNLLYFQMDLDHAVHLLSRLGHLELYQEDGFTHLNEVMRTRMYLAFGLSSICHFDPRLGFGLRLYGC